MAAVIHVKLTGEGDFGPVDLECAIPPARLPLVMAALFGSPTSLRAGAVQGGGAVDHGAASSGASMSPAMLAATSSTMSPSASSPSAPSSSFGPGGSLWEMPAGGQFPVTARSDRSGPVLSPARSAITSEAETGPENVPGQAAGQAVGRDFGGAGLVGEGAADAIDPANFLIGYIGSLGDLIARLQPRGFAETILIAAIWLHYRDGRSFVTRDDIRRLLRRQEHLRMPKNFGRDFHSAITRGYIEPADGDGGFAATGTGYQWFRDACIK
ncbi:hypothetical protein [Thalassospira lucentensis]|uniref:hypothetical protein n=1 Tax=Thalassospira lucentensis TaxID=168935 RepID=UPI0029435044|nr:hypothetical protein [Thalassospira lucentensis]WOI10178.1 hypothetical protein R1T41_16820 [Thalassospira lucentensis]